MTRRALLAAACALFVAASTGTFAQSGASDPVTGKWGTGGIVFLELQSDGHGTVTGTTIWRQSGGVEQRAAIKSGTFDARSGELTLTGEAERHGKQVDYEIEGTIKDGTLTGTSDIGGEKKPIRFARQ